MRRAQRTSWPGGFAPPTLLIVFMHVYKNFRGGACPPRPVPTPLVTIGLQLSGSVAPFSTLPKTLNTCVLMALGVPIGCPLHECIIKPYYFVSYIVT